MVIPMAKDEMVRTLEKHIAAFLKTRIAKKRLGLNEIRNIQITGRQQVQSISSLNGCSFDVATGPRIITFELELKPAPCPPAKRNRWAEKFPEPEPEENYDDVDYED